MKYFFLILISLFFYLIFSPYEGVCLKVLDGDTIIFERWGKEERVRLLYIDTPEEGQGEVANLSTSYLKEKIEGKRIRLTERSKDMYGRTLAVIYFGKLNINFEIIQKGLAFPYRFQKFKNARQKRLIISAYEKAKLNKQGIFKNSKILEPYLYRRSIRY